MKHYKRLLIVHLKRRSKAQRGRGRGAGEMRQQWNALFRLVIYAFLRFVLVVVIMEHKNPCLPAAKLLTHTHTNSHTHIILHTYIWVVVAAQLIRQCFHLWQLRFLPPNEQKWPGKRHRMSFTSWATAKGFAFLITALLTRYLRPSCILKIALNSHAAVLKISCNS